MIEIMLIDSEKIQIQIHALLFQRIIGGTVSQIQNLQVIILPLDKVLVHAQCLRIFVHNYIIAVGTEELLVIVQEKPGVYIGLHDHLPGQIHGLQFFLHIVIGTLKEADQRRRQILIELAVHIGFVHFAIVAVRRDQDTIRHLRMVAAAADELSIVNILHIHVHITYLQRRATVGTT